MSWPLGIKATKLYRDERLSGILAPPADTTIWHSVYIGLGYIDNPYGIRYEDGVAYAAAKRIDPNVVYLGPGYPHAMRKLMLRMVEHHPGFVARSLFAKLRAVIRHSISQFWLGLGLTFLALSFGRSQSERRRTALLAGPATIITLVPPVLVMPFTQYELGFFGAAGFLWLLGVLWTVAAAERLVPRLVDGGSAAGTRTLKSLARSRAS